MHIVRRHGWDLGAAGNGGARGAEPAKPRQRDSLPSLAAADRRSPGVQARPGHEKYATTCNDCYEFGESKNIWRGAQALRQGSGRSGWTVMAKPRTVDIDDLLKQVMLEERVYRHRCVEG